ncbi:HNH endonuclease [Streptomyces sp. NPDC059002]|uniref:HNH endonuclease n=1 Tax=Streptomyces sp. NPDC059002 TaxID=3346690 RepID=UPI0036910D13
MTKLCDFRTARIQKAGATSSAAAAQWKAAKAVKRQIKGLLEEMAPVRTRCMYCLDNRGTDIDHFEPKSLNPLRTFSWDNHLLACSHCNSNVKRDAFPRDPDTGECLLINPTVDDPADHLKLRLGSGEITHRTTKGKVSIEVFGLRHPDLVEGRAAACGALIALLINWNDLHSRGSAEEAARVATLIDRSGFPDVLRAMEKLAGSPLAAMLQDRKFPEALSAWVASPGRQGAIPPMRTGSPASLPAHP